MEELLLAQGGDWAGLPISIQSALYVLLLIGSAFIKPTYDFLSSLSQRKEEADNKKAAGEQAAAELDRVHRMEEYSNLLQLYKLQHSELRTEFADTVRSMSADIKHLTEENTALRIENAVLKERCDNVN